MTPRRFLSQQDLVNWTDDGKIDVQGQRLVVVSDKSVASISEAVRFMKLVSGEDSKGLLAKVKTTEQLKELGAEHYLDSVILGETAYEVQQGYLTEVTGGPAATASGEAPANPAAPAPVSRTNGPDADMLANFILGKI